MRNYNQEFEQTADRKYAYDFDYRMHDYLLRTFSPHFKGDAALELGCYEGEFTVKLLPYFSSITVVDASSHLIAKAQARTRSLATFMLSTFEAVDFGKQQFDAIFLIHTLEHLDKPQEVLCRMHQWLSPDGKLYVAVPNANAISRQIAVKMGLVDYQISVTQGEHLHGHRRTYTLDSLEYEIKRAGFTLERTGGVFFKPFANFQFDQLMANSVIDDAYLEGCFELGKKYPDFCASIFAICSSDGKRE